MNQFEDLVGKTLTKVETFTMHVQGGGRATLYHGQDCCESVTLEEVIGNVEDLIGHPILVAEEVSNGTEDDPEGGYLDDSHTWTFYTLRMVKGSVTLRWLGQSNGYYSESVDFRYD